MMDAVNVIATNSEQLPETLSLVFTYWKRLKCDNWVTSLSCFKLNKVSFKLLPWSVIVDVSQYPFDFYYRFWGTERDS